MSNELMTMPDFLAPAAIQDELDQQEALVNPASLFPLVRLNKDVRGFMISMGDQNLGTPQEMQFLILGSENVYGSRALFQPGESDDTSPVCSTSNESPSKQDAWVGRWNTESGHESPANGLGGVLTCGACPWSQFGSDADWDNTRNGKGPACKQRRTVYGIRVEESSKRGMFTVQDDTVMRLVLPATSIKSISAMVAKATAARMPLSAAVFNISAKMHNRGSVKWCTLEADLVGCIGDKGSYDRIQELRKKVNGIVSRDTTEDTMSYAETSATAAQASKVSEDEIPF